MTTKRMATSHAAGGEHQAPNGAVGLERFDGVGGAGRLETAAAADDGGQEHLVPANE